MTGAENHGSKAPDFDEVVGSNIRRFRTARGQSQAELADALSEKMGERVHQQTVQKIEKGARPLKYAEALAICGLLDLLDPYDLTAGDEEASLIARKLELIQSVGQLGEELHGIAGRLADKLVKLARTPQTGRTIDSDANIFLMSNWGQVLNGELTRRLLPEIAGDQPVEDPTYLDILKAIGFESAIGPDDVSDT